MNPEYYVNVARTMGILPRPRLKCTLHDDCAETLSDLPIIKVRSELNVMHILS